MVSHLLHRPSSPSLSLLFASMSLFYGASLARANEAAEQEAETQATEIKNNRADTVDGSESTWSGQLNFNYYGSSLNHPFSKEVPNPTDQVPPPLAQLQGTVAIRYRINASTTAGLATGVTTVAPLQGKQLQSHTTVANPQLDIANTIKFGHWHQYIDLSLVRYTDYQDHIQYGYEWNPGVSEEIAYYFDSGLAMGLQASVNYTTFADNPDYDRSQQLELQIVGGPFAEYAINDTFSIRTVLNGEEDHDRDLSNRQIFHYPKLNQTFGLATQVTQSFWLYAYVLAIPYDGTPMTPKNTTMGLQTVINLF